MKGKRDGAKRAKKRRSITQVMEHCALSEADRARKDAMLAIKDAYTDDTRLFIRFLNQRRIAIDYNGLVAWAIYLRASRCAAATINKRLAGAKNRLRLLFRDSPESLDVLSRYKLDSLLKDVRGVKLNSREVGLDKILSMPQLRSLATSSKVRLRTRLFIEFLAVTGLRVSELCRIRTADVSTDRGVSTVRILGKGQKERQVRVRRELVDRVRSCFHGKTFLFERRGGAQYTRQHVSRGIRAAGQVVLKRRISAHTLRHTFATLQIRKTHKVKGVSLYLGHSSTAITQDMYVHEELDLDELALDLGRKTP